MRATYSYLLVLTCLAGLLAALPAVAQGGFVPPASPELVAQITALDRQLFDAVFDRCDPQQVAALVTEDFEFYHDKSGQVADTGGEFVESIRGLCERQRQGTDFKARRELVDGSLEVYPLKGYGAVEVGLHRFFKLTPGKPDEMTETARFTHLWKNENGTWRLARVLSYDHRPPH